MINLNQFRNVFWLTFSQGVNFLFPVFMFPILARRLGIHDFGKYTLFLSVCTIGASLCDYGYNIYGIKDVAANKTNFNKINQIIQSSFAVRMVVSFFLILAFYIMSLFTNWMDNFIIFNIFLYLFASIFNITWFFQGLSDNKEIGLLNAFVKCFQLFLIFFMARTVEVAILVQTLLFVIFIICQLVLFRFKGYQLNISFKDVFSKLREGMIYFLPNLFGTLMTNVSTLALGVNFSPKVAGGFSAADKIVRAVAGLNIPLYQAAFPKLSEKINNDQRDGFKTSIFYAIFTVVIFTILAILINIYSSKIMYTFFGEDYIRYSDVLKISVFYVPLAALNSVIGIIMMFNLNMGRIYNIAMLVGLIISSAFYFYFVKFFGYIAMSYGILSGEISLSLICIISLFHFAFYHGYIRRNNE